MTGRTLPINAVVSGLFAHPRTRREYTANTTRPQLTSSRSEFVWRELLLAAVGEQFSDALQTGDDISGVTASIRQYVLH